MKDFFLLKFSLIFVAGTTFTLTGWWFLFFKYFADVYAVWLTIPLHIFLAVLLIDIGYNWNENWVGSMVEEQRSNFFDDEATSTWQWAIIAASGILFLWGCSCYIAMFVWGTFSSGLFWLFSLATIVLTIGLGVAGSVEQIAPHGNIITHCIVFLWAAWAVNFTSFIRYLISPLVHSAIGPYS